MINLQTKMIELADYNIGCRMNNGYFLVNITFKEGWSVIPTEDEQIECGMDNGVYYYCAPVTDYNFQQVFTSIDDTIQYNLDLQKKVELFKEKVSELQDIFANEDYETLASLEFKIKKPKRKYVSKKKERVEDAICEEASSPVEETSMGNEEIYDDDEIVYNEYTGEDEDNIVKPLEEIER